MPVQPESVGSPFGPMAQLGARLGRVAARWLLCVLSLCLLAPGLAVAVLEGSVQQNALRQMLAGFGLDAELVPAALTVLLAGGSNAPAATPQPLA